MSLLRCSARPASWSSRASLPNNCFAQQLEHPPVPVLLHTPNSQMRPGITQALRQRPSVHSGRRCSSNRGRPPTCAPLSLSTHSRPVAFRLPLSLSKLTEDVLRSFGQALKDSVQRGDLRLDLSSEDSAGPPVTITPSAQGIRPAATSGEAPSEGE